MLSTPRNPGETWTAGTVRVSPQRWLSHRVESGAGTSAGPHPGGTFRAHSSLPGPGVSAGAFSLAQAYDGRCPSSLLRTEALRCIVRSAQGTGMQLDVRRADEARLFGPCLVGESFDVQSTLRYRTGGLDPAFTYVVVGRRADGSRAFEFEFTAGLRAPSPEFDGAGEATAFAV